MILPPHSIPYNYVNLDMLKAEMKSDWYVGTINPNGKAPAIVHVKDDGTSVTVWESGACLLYVAHEFDKDHRFSYPIGTPEYWSQMSWVRCVLLALPTQSWEWKGYANRSHSYHGRYRATAP